jgi:hypothetical protein
MWMVVRTCTVVKKQGNQVKATETLTVGYDISRHQDDWRWFSVKPSDTLSSIESPEGLSVSEWSRKLSCWSNYAWIDRLHSWWYSGRNFKRMDKKEGQNGDNSDVEGDSDIATTDHVRPIPSHDEALNCVPQLLTNSSTHQPHSVHECITGHTVCVNNRPTASFMTGISRGLGTLYVKLKYNVCLSR